MLVLIRRGLLIVAYCLWPATLRTQGYHDVGSVFLLTLGDQRAFEVFQRVSESYHREPMGAGFETVMQTTRLLFPLLNAEDSELHAYIRESGVRLRVCLVCALLMNS